MKTKSNKLAKLERHRFSVFTDDLGKCFYCNSTNVQKHEIMSGSNRLNSMRYGYILPLCPTHHDMLQYDRAWMGRCQDHFEQTHSNEEWLNIFHRNYKD